MARSLITERAETMIDELFYIFREEVQEVVDLMPGPQHQFDEEEVKELEVPKLGQGFSMEFEDNIET